MLDKRLKKSIETHLEPGEEVLSHTVVQRKGMARATMAGGVLGAAAYGAVQDRRARDADRGVGAATDTLRLASRMAVVITPRRLLVFQVGGAWTLMAKELLAAVPIGDVDSIDIGGGTLTKKVTVTARGEAHPVEAPRFAKPQRMVDALARAKAAAPVST